MELLDALYDHYNRILTDLQGDSGGGITTDLLQCGITREYYEKVHNAVELLYEFYYRYINDKKINSAVSASLGSSRKMGVKFCVLVDVMRCYDGLDHPTSFNTREGVALLILLDRMIGMAKIGSYEQLAVVEPVTLGLIDIIPHLCDCSFALGERYSLFMSSILEKVSPSKDRLYRRILYNLCKIIAEVDGVITVAENDWLNEIALLNDDDPDNDIDVSGL